MAEVDPLFLRHESHQVLFDLFGVLFLGQAQPAADARHVSIHHDSRGDTARGTQYDIGGFAPYPRQLDQGLEVAWDLAAVLAD